MGARNLRDGFARSWQKPQGQAQRLAAQGGRVVQVGWGSQPRPPLLPRREPHHLAVPVTVLSPVVPTPISCSVVLPT